MTSLERFQRFFSSPRQPTDRPLVWPFCMSIAARNLGVPYKRYAEDPVVRAQAQVMLAEDFDLDLVTVCSDPTAEAEDCGAQVLWFDNDPPAPDPAATLLRDKQTLATLKTPSLASGHRTQDRLECIRKLKELGRGRYPIIGWVEGPISMAAVLRGLNPLMEDILDDPDWVDELFEFCLSVAIPFARAQVEAGADMIGFGDAPASLVSLATYERHILPFEARLVQAIHEAGAPVRLHICGNTTHLAPAIASLGVELVDVDALADLRTVAAALPAETAVLGNLDPVRDVLNGTPEHIKRRLHECRDVVGQRFVVGAGCEIPAATADENLRAFAEFADRG